MSDEYILYECNKCGINFIIPIEGINKAEMLKRFISCPLGHKTIYEVSKYQGLKECMESVNTYKRVGGRIKQYRFKK